VLDLWIFFKYICAILNICYNTRNVFEYKNAILYYVYHIYIYYNRINKLIVVLSSTVFLFKINRKYSGKIIIVMKQSDS